MFETIRSYIFWSYERGSVPYDVMVTLILAFMFLSPRFINYNDRPVETVALHASEVLVKEAGTTKSGSSRFMYQIRADDLQEEGWPPRLGEQVVRVASCRQTNLQCFQILEQEGHNERRIAIPRSARSTALFDRQMRPSSRTRVNAGQRLSM